MKLLTLDLQYFAGEKTEKATPKKRQDARKKGQVAKSQDVNVAIGLLAVFLFFLFSGSYLKKTVISLFEHSFQEYMKMELTEENIQIIFLELVRNGFIYWTNHACGSCCRCCI